MDAAGQGSPDVSTFALAWSVVLMRQVLMQPPRFDWIVSIRENLPSHPPSVWIEGFSAGHMMKVNGTFFNNVEVSQGRSVR